MSPWEDPDTVREMQLQDLAAEAKEPGYTRSNGVWVPLSAMVSPHLKSAFAKLAREFPDHPELGPMETEIAKRDAEYQAAQAEAQTQ